MNSGIQSGMRSWNVSYDALGRITGFDGGATGGGKSTYVYDANGNRQRSTKTETNGETTAREYAIDPASNKLNGFMQQLGSTRTNVSFGYNANGDLTSDGLKRFGYDAESRLSSVTTGASDTSPTTRYAHNAIGQRVFKTDPQFPPNSGDEGDPGFFQSLVSFFDRLWAPAISDGDRLGTAYVYGEDGSLLSETGTGGPNSTGTTHYIYLPTASGPMPIAAFINGVPYAVHSDQLNTPRRMTDANAQVVWQWAYSAFGDEEPTTAHNRFANLAINANPGTTAIPDIAISKRYEGMVKDNESGLFHNGLRSYSSDGLGYLQNDFAGLFAGPNRKVYAFNDPLSFVDPDGYEPLKPSDIRPIPLSPMPGGGGRRKALSQGAPIKPIEFPAPFCPPAATSVGSPGTELEFAL